MPEVEIFTPTGVVSGTSPGVPMNAEGEPSLAGPLVVDDVRWYPLDRSPASVRDQVAVALDDMLIIATDEQPMVVHMSWYPVTLDVGPYRVSGQIGMHPGFDAERALARPSSNFVGLREATIELLGREDAGPAERAAVHVNRYAVERVASSLMLGFFFPGAQLAPLDAVPEREPVSATIA